MTRAGSSRSLVEEMLEKLYIILIDEKSVNCSNEFALPNFSKLLETAPLQVLYSIEY